MSNLITRSFAVKAIILVLFASMAPALMGVYLSFQGAKDALGNIEVEKLEASRDRAKESIIQYLSQASRDLQLLARTWSVRLVCKSARLFSNVDAEPTKAESNVFESDRYKRLVEPIEGMFQEWLGLYESARA